MKTKQRKITLIVLLCAFFAALGLLFAFAASDTGIVWADTVIETDYALGTEFTVPEQTVSNNGIAVKADFTLEYPNGTATTKKTVILDQTGEYCLNYTARLGGKPYVKTYTFFVHKNYISHGNDTTLNWGKHPFADTEGLLVRLMQGDSLTFSKPISVGDMTSDNLLISGFITPDIRGASEFNELLFTFTDTVDPSVSMLISLKRYEGFNGHAYVRAAGNGQPVSGYESATGKMHQNNKWGTWTDVSFSAMKSNKLGDAGVNVQADAIPLNVYFDHTTKLVTANGSYVVDLDDPAYFDNLWTGFPSGSVLLTISAVDTTSTANFCLTHILGQDLSKYADIYKDEEPPVLTVHSDYETMPEAKIGGAYPVPAATALDAYCGATAVKTSVYFNYNSQNRFLIDIKDGKFATNYSGNYTIVYEATDLFGNTATELLAVHAGRAIPEIEATVSGDKVTAAHLGEWVEIPALETLTGGSGKLVTTVTVACGGEEYVAEGGFRPEAVGTWTVTYKITDYVGNAKEVSYSVEATVGSTAVLVDEIHLPKAFISGQPYVIPEVYANDYRSGTLVRKLFDVDVTDANGTVSYKAGDTFIPLVSSNGDPVTLSFRCETELASYSVPAIQAWTSGDTPALQVENYFLGSPFTVQKTREGIVMKLTSANADAGWTFANPVVAGNFQFIFSGASGGARYSKMQVILTDSYDSAVSVLAELVPDGSSTRFVVGNSANTLEASLGAAGKQFTVGYSNGVLSLNGLSVTLTETESGAPFKGFPSDKVYLTVRLLNAQANASYSVISLNGQLFTDSTRDQTGPTITIFGDYGGSYTIGDEYIIHRAIAGDVLAPNVEFTMTVRDPNGAVARDKKGELLQNVDPTVERVLELAMYGSYSVIYTAREAASFVARPTTYTLPYNIIVEDRIAPEITLTGSFQTTAKVGDTLIIPNFTVSDNVTATDKIIVTKYVVSADGKLITIPQNSNAIVCSMAGIYEFRIIARDEAGNITLVSARITVTA